MLVCKEFTFDSAHRLPDYNGPCAQLHGHTYRLQVVVEGQIDKNGMVIDFADLKQLVQKTVLIPLDHHYLNDLLKQPTAENIAEWIWQQLQGKLNLFEIRLWETPTSFVIRNRSEL